MPTHNSPTRGLRLPDTLVSRIFLVSACLPAASLHLLSWTQNTVSAEPPSAATQTEFHSKGGGSREESWVAPFSSSQGRCPISSLSWAARHTGLGEHWPPASPPQLLEHRGSWTDTDQKPEKGAAGAGLCPADTHAGFLIPGPSGKGGPTRHGAPPG